MRSQGGKIEGIYTVDMFDPHLLKFEFKRFAAIALVFVSLAGGAQTRITTVDPHVKERDVRADMEFLASDALQGRGSGTQFELIAGTYIASQLREFGIEPAGDPETDGKPGYIQTVNLVQPSFASPPVLTAGSAHFTHGKEIAVLRASSAEWKGPLQHWKPDTAVRAGGVVLIRPIEGQDAAPLRAQLNAVLLQKPTAVLLADSAGIRKMFSSASSRSPGLPTMEKGGAPMTMGGGSNIVLLGTEATSQLESIGDGTEVSLRGELKEDRFTTWNVVGKLTGRDQQSAGEAVLLGAHMDHLGVNPKLQGDQIYNGADDDASGTIAVLELARVLGAGPKPKRTVYFVLFGSEEKGGLGSGYFLNHSPVALNKIVTEMEFEMLGRPDNKVPAQTLWLTGYERSNLGPELAAHGALLVADPHPEENFFSRSDNYSLAKRGVVAHTVSSFGLHKDYHQPSDDISHIDFTHLTTAIDSMVKPVMWLVDSDFVPKWNPGKRP